LVSGFSIVPEGPWSQERPGESGFIRDSELIRWNRKRPTRHVPSLSPGLLAPAAPASHPSRHSATPPRKPSPNPRSTARSYAPRPRRAGISRGGIRRTEPRGQTWFLVLRPFGGMEKLKRPPGSPLAIQSKPPIPLTGPLRSKNE
jgi:hypothetical protein